MLSRMSIRNKLALVLWSASLLAFLAVAGGLLLYRNLTLESRALRIMEPYAQLVSVGTESAVAFEDPVRAQEVLDSLRINPHILAAQIMLEDGRVLAGFGSGFKTEELRPPANQPEGIQLNGSQAHLTQRLPVSGHLHLLMSLDPLDEQTRRALWFFGAWVLVLAAATIGQLLVLRRTISHPVAKLAEAAERVRTAGDYSSRVPAAGSDEIGRLGQSFNAMMEAVREREHALQQVTAFQRTILDNAAYGIVSTDSNGIVTSFNPAAERLLAYPASEVVGKRTPELWHHPEEVDQRARQLSEELGEPITPGFEVFAARARRNLPDENEWTFIRKDGAGIPVLLSVTALRNEKGELTGFLGLVSDLTERKRAEEQIRTFNRELEQRVIQRTAELEAANKELESFSYSVSHDLRAPLRAIDGFSALLERKYQAVLDEEAQRLIHMIRAGSASMAQLIDDILQFSRMTRREMALAPVDMSSLALEAFEEARNAVPERRISLHLAELPPASGDRALIRQVLANLLGNAVKFTAPREEAIIEVEGTIDGEQNLYRVKDNGVGFDMRYANKLFGVFQRLHGADEFEGTGIGLAIVKRIVNRHGGRVWAESRQGEGATLFFTLPGMAPYRRENPDQPKLP